MLIAASINPSACRPMRQSFFPAHHVRGSDSLLVAMSRAGTRSGNEQYGQIGDFGKTVLSRRGGQLVQSGGGRNVRDFGQAERRSDHPGGDNTFRRLLEALIARVAADPVNQFAQRGAQPL